MATDSYIKLRKLTTSTDDPIEDILRRGMTELRGLVAKATVELRLIGDAGPGARAVHAVRLTPAGASLAPEGVAKPTLVVVTTPETFRAMANGSYAPSQAYLDGKVRILGNADLAKQIVTKLGGSGTEVAVCPTLYDESYKPNGEGGGEITLNGEFFTPGGTVEIVYNWGGGQYQQIVVASSSGDFTVSEGLYCGDIPGHPGVGVIVTATDLSTGKYTTQNYSTPC